MPPNISSRTPEGFPSHCVLCGAAANLEYSDPAGDAPCPNCGHLLWLSAQILDEIRLRFATMIGVSPDDVDLDSFIADLAADSLEVVELMMEFEDEFGVTVPDDDYEKIRTIGDVVRYIERWRREHNRE